MKGKAMFNKAKLGMEKRGLSPIIAINALLFFSASLLSSCSLYLHHKENEMREQFSQHFDTLVQLEQMQRIDIGVHRLTLNSIDVDQGVNNASAQDASISEERLDSYRTLFHRAGVEGGFQRMTTMDKSRRIEFRHDNSKFGFTYRESIPIKDFKSFNECRAIKFDDKYRCYVFLRTNWYMHMGTINEYVK
jgi:hypothetical protein